MMTLQRITFTTYASNAWHMCSYFFVKLSDNVAYYRILYCDYVQLKFKLLMIIAMTVVPK